MRPAPIMFLLAVFWLCPWSPAAAVEAPSEIAGFRLGGDITEYPDIEYTNYLKDVVVTDWHGFRKGIISYGVCAYPGKIVKIVLKYEDSSRDFYEKLLTAFKQKFGRPTEWKGDAFGVLLVWKWIFTDEDNRRVNLILQHNLQDHNENIGNIVKLSYPERDEEERLCFIERCDRSKSEEQKERLRTRKDPDWEYMIPR